MNTERLKKLAAGKAVEEISSGMIVGLGTGSTVQFALEKISEKITKGELKNILCIPSSSNTEKEARRLGIPLTTFNELIITNGELQISNSQFAIGNSQLVIDVTIDGADELTLDHPDPDLSGEGANQINLIKGGGGALLREKILAQTSKKFIVIIDESKLSTKLGSKFPLPVEVVQFAASIEQKYLESLGAKVVRRKNAEGKIYITDEGNYIIDAKFDGIDNPKALAELLNSRAGIVEHGLFIGMTSKLICAMNNGDLRIDNC